MRKLFPSFLFLFACLYGTESRSQCAGGQSSTVTPNSPFTAGQVVTICYSVSSYTQTTSNWIHAYLIDLGSAWDPNSIVITQYPPGGTGQWGYYNSVFSNATNQSYGPGVFYDQGNDNNPGNNFGYNCPGCSSTLCFTVTMQDPSLVTDINIMVTSDGTTGSWGAGTGACAETWVQVITAPPCSYSVVPSTTDPTCTASNGSVNLTLNGGTAPFSFSWSNFETTQNISNLAAGFYSVTATDASGCSTTASANLVVDYSAGPSISLAKTEPTCAGNDGTITLTVTGGAQPLVYNWSPALPNLPNQSGLVQGNYAVTVSDANGCSVDTNTVLTVTNITQVDVQQPQPMACHDACTGKALAVATAGAAPYTYNWSNGETDAQATALCPGTSTITLTDAYGCTNVDSINLVNPPALAIAFTTQAVSCFGVSDGIAIATTTNGLAPLTYSWTTNTGFTTGITGDSAMNIPGGTYYVSVTDYNSCTATGNVTVVQPLPILLDFQIHNTKCYGSSDGYIEFAAAQGTSPYTFVWSTGATLGDNIDLMGLASGPYSVTVTDASGCTLDSLMNVGQPDPLGINFGSYPASCDIAHDGIDSAFAYGGTPDYNYVWNTVPQTIGYVANNLGVGTYTVTVTDANNCVAIDSSYVVGFPVFGVDATADVELVRGFMTALSVTADTLSFFTYSWAPQESVMDPYTYMTYVKPDSTTTYTVTVTDIGTGCFNTDTVVVTVTPNPYVHIPTAFSPNGDDRNDMFYAFPGDGVTIKSFRVYDRWGNLIFNGDWFPGWDGRHKGKASPMGVYVYVCEYTLVDGTASVAKGSVTLLR
jgi:gliding motility-associated-like protein